MSIEASGTAVQVATARANFALDTVKQSADSEAQIADILLSSVEAGNVTATRGNNVNITV